jgi:hypothetical protein
MRSSETIDQLSAALAKAQGEIAPPSKDRTARVRMKSGGEYTFNYIGLDGILDAVRKPLSANGLSITQGVGSSGGTNGNQWVLTTRLMHSGGQWIEADYPMHLGGTPQERGSELTYSRRYALCALLGIAAEEDDDGNAASGNGAKVTPRQVPPRKPAAPAPRIKDAEEAPMNDVEQGFAERGIKPPGDMDDDEKFIAILRDTFESRDFKPDEFSAAVAAVCKKKKITTVNKLSGTDRMAFLEAVAAGRFDNYKAAVTA